jgi:hypothetical protein
MILNSNSLRHLDRMRRNFGQRFGEEIAIKPHGSNADESA